MKANEATHLTKNKKQSLYDLCIYFDNNSFNEEEGQVDKFVGLRFIDGKLSVYFPVGYRKPNKADEKEVRRDILNLISVLSTFTSRESAISNPAFLNTKEVDFPIHAYLYIINDFLNHGYFQQKEQIYRRSTSGKISWARTIKQIRPQIIDGSAVYLDFVTHHSNHNENELITLIHKFCVHECFEKIGYLFSSYIPQKSPLAFNKNLFTAVIKTKASSTFNESELLLFKNMLNVINSMDSNGEKKNFIFGTDNFHHVWEQLVDSVYGEKDKDSFYPKVYWKFKNSKTFSFSEKRNSLRPDTIMITNRGNENQKIFVLDSKYYRYGATKNPNHLPDSASVVKQLAYAQYIDNTEIRSKLPEDVRPFIKSRNIYNAFIMPADNESPENIGFVSAEYVLPQDSEQAEKPYNQIYGILLDVKIIMYCHIPHDKKLIDELSEKIYRL
ncbi:LlaJI family restriction endonuclease [Treponema sp.]|uniref:LlaJI family restriction endonuclease n=1 Tax=Treponema sp. TaxID=166 RepID=UPI003EFECA5E